MRMPLRLFTCHSVVITCTKDGFPPCSTRLLWGTVWRLSSVWGQRTPRVGRGRRKKRGAGLLVCQGLSQLGKDSTCDCPQVCCATWQPAAVQSWCLAENTSLFIWKVSFPSPQTLYIQASDCQIVVSQCLTGISHLRCSAKVTGERGYSLCWSSSKFFILP